MDSWITRYCPLLKRQLLSNCVFSNYLQFCLLFIGYFVARDLAWIAFLFLFPARPIPSPALAAQCVCLCFSHFVKIGSWHSQWVELFCRSHWVWERLQLILEASWRQCGGILQIALKVVLDSLSVLGKFKIYYTLIFYSRLYSNMSPGCFLLLFERGSN